MKLSILVTLAATSIFPGGTLAALTAPQVVVNINTVANVSGNLNTIVSELSTTTSPSTVITMSKIVVTDFTTIINSLTTDIPAMQATPPFADPEAKTIVVTLNNFVKIHQALLSTVIGKHSIFAQFGVTAPIAAVLRSLEAVIDSFAFAMIAIIPTHAPSVKNGQSGLDQSVSNSIDLYLQICVPSPLYPGLMPICASL